MMAGFLFFIIHFWRFRNPYQIGILLRIPMIGILVNYLVMERSLKKLQALRVATVQPAPLRAETTRVRRPPPF